MMILPAPVLPFGNGFPVNVQISIFSNGSNYTAYINTDGGILRRFLINLKPEDIVELNFGLQEAIEQVSTDFEVEGVTNDTISKLALKGNFALKSIFSDDAVRKLLSSALRKGTIVQISSDELFIPWELLYDGTLNETMNFNRFWGMQAIVARAIVQDDRPGDYLSPIIEATRPRVGLIACNELEHVVGKEIPVLKSLHRSKQIQLSSLRPLKASQREKDLEDLGRFLSKDIQIVHLACHACERKPMSQSYLLISDAFSITIEDFVAREYQIKNNPFVILNACLTGTLSPRHTSNWAALFWKRGARGVLATELRIPDSFAAAFAEILYMFLLAGRPIGEALLTTRRYFWENQGNPLGLAYALYSSPAVRIANSN
jgi:CHAT domain